MPTPKLVRHDTKRIVRGTPHEQAHEELAVEAPMELRVNKEPVAVLMRTPGDDFDLASGYLFTHGVVQNAKDISVMRHLASEHDGDDRNVLDATLAAGVKFDGEKVRRATLSQMKNHPKPIQGKTKVRLEVFYSLGNALRRAQTVFERTGGLHAAGIFDAKGTLLGLREDIASLNAVDKMLGSMFTDGKTPLDHHILMVSGRAGYDLMHKALVARIPIVAAIQAPTSMAVAFANEMGQTLVGYVRADAFNIYAHGDRVEVS
jgi:FdhD protein